MLGHEPSQVRRGTEGSTVHLGQPEDGIVRGDDDIGIADEPDATPDAEAIDRDDNRHGALIDRLEGGIAATVGPQEGIEPGRPLHLLDVDARVEALALRSEHDHSSRGIPTSRVERLGHREPARDGQRVDRRIVHDDLDDARVVTVEAVDRDPVRHVNLLGAQWLGLNGSGLMTQAR